MKYDRLYRNASLRDDVAWQKLCAMYDVDCPSPTTPKAKLRLINKLNAIYYWERCHATPLI